MADGKKSFLLYCDIIHTVSKMPDEMAGRLFKHILEYVNDLEPKTDDLIIQLSFEPIRQALKRDLEKWESIRNRNKINGLSGGRPKTQDNPEKPSGLLDNPDEPKKPVSVIVSDIVIEKEEKKKVFSFLEELLKLGVENQIAKDWLLVRKTKKAANTETALKAVKKEILTSGMSANDCIKYAVERNWVGFKASWVDKTEITSKKCIIDLLT